MSDKVFTSTTSDASHIENPATAKELQELRYLRTLDDADYEAHSYKYNFYQVAARAMAQVSHEDSPKKVQK